MKCDGLLRTLWIGLLIGLLSQSLGCTCICWTNYATPRLKTTVAFPDEALVGSDGRVVLRVPDWEGFGHRACVECSGAAFRDALRAHIGLAAEGADADGALPWPSGRVVTMNARTAPTYLRARSGEVQNMNWQYAGSDYGSWPDQKIATVRHPARDREPAVFPYEMDGATYRVAVELRSDDRYTPWWYWPGLVPCAAVDLVTLPLQVVAAAVIVVSD